MVQIFRFEVKDWQGCNLKSVILQLSLSNGALLCPLLIYFKNPRKGLTCSEMHLVMFSTLKKKQKNNTVSYVIVFRLRAGGKACSSFHPFIGSFALSIICRKILT